MDHHRKKNLKAPIYLSNESRKCEDDELNTYGSGFCKLIEATPITCVECLLFFLDIFVKIIVVMRVEDFIQRKKV